MSKYLTHLGHLFKSTSRVTQPIYAYGRPGTQKTSLLTRVVTSVIPDILIGRVENTSGAFQYADIVNKEVIIFNDFNPEAFDKETIQELLDRNPVMVQRKNRSACSVKVNKFLFTSNDGLDVRMVKKPYPEEGQLEDVFEALRRRLFLINFKLNKDQNTTFLEKADFADTIHEESIGLAILSCYCLSFAEAQMDTPELMATLLTKGFSFPESWKKQDYTFVLPRESLTEDEELKPIVFSLGNNLFFYYEDFSNNPRLKAWCNERCEKLNTEPLQRLEDLDISFRKREKSYRAYLEERFAKQIIKKKKFPKKPV